MRISASEWVLGDRPTAIRRAAAAGFDAIELDAIPGIDIAALQDDLAAAGLAVPSMCWAWNSESELGSPDPASRARAQTYLRGALEQAHELGASQIVVLPACRKDPWTDEPRIRGLERAAASIAEVLPDTPSDVGIALEGLRRIESFLMNTLDHSALVRSMIGHDDRVGLLADWYHVVVEEIDPVASMRQHAEAISLVHLAATERGPLLADSVGAAELAAQLRDMPAVRSYTIEYNVGDDDAALAQSLIFARSV
ncbi:sugar phosphate isomerase/epimerase [Microbacterium sp. cf332]|uniref:sugar phosphate isomerase/epimerase family protein n=1 Tax=Microbacterium sp. cf332 TaxID=1761804 RepID=UPI00088C7CFD|nr:TIM barrel protein [Microbacterium sp. cf332]SDQ58097.1 Sugar phosphate isomerase/epimerase [Microbacterium sp. cf332]